MELIFPVEVPPKAETPTRIPELMRLLLASFKVTVIVALFPETTEAEDTAIVERVLEGAPGKT